MRRYLQVLRRSYGLLLNLFPGKYREEYGAELQAVFGLSLDDAVARGGFEVERLIFRELLSLPKAIVLEHLRERNETMTRTFDSYFNFVYGSWTEFLTALLPFFLLGAAYPLLQYLRTSNQLATEVMLALFSFFIILLIVGLQMGLPRWSLPYLGSIFSILSVYVFSFLLGTPIYFLFRNYREASLLIDIVWDGIFWYGLLIVIVFFVAKSRTSPALQHFRDDWTQLCFLLYGAIPFALMLTFDEYVGDEPYTMLAFLVLAVGAWFYLRNTGEWKRFGVLFGALTVAIGIAAVAKMILVPKQTWPFTLDASLAVSEVKHTIIIWVWFAIGMLIPLALRFLPPVDASMHISPSEG